MDRETMTLASLRRRRFVALEIAMLSAWLVVAGIASQGVAQPAIAPVVVSANDDPPEPRLLDREPYDVLVLNDKERTTERLVPLADRKPPVGLKPDDVLRVRLKSEPAVEFDVRWGDVAELRMFEDLLLEEARRLTAAGEFNEVFEYLLVLRRKHSSILAIQQAELEFLAAEARHEMSVGRHENALLIARRMVAIDPKAALTADALVAAVEPVVQNYVSHNDHFAARSLVAQTLTQFPTHPTAIRLRNQLATLARERLELANQAVAADRPSEAQSLLIEALALAPDLQAAEALHRGLVASHPRVLVGVVQSSNRDGGGFPRRLHLDDWPLRRSSRLTCAPPLEPMFSDDGSGRLIYADGWAGWRPDARAPRRANLVIVAPRDGRTAFDLAEHLCRAARGTGEITSPRPPLAVRPVDRATLEIHLKHTLPRPEALIANLVSELASESAIPIVGNYRIAEAAPPTTRFVRDAQAASDAALRPPVEIIERRFADEEEAVVALRQGHVDVVDRLAPWQIGSLRDQPDVTLCRYAAPGVHCLRFNPNNPLLQQVEFRRAIIYAVDRAGILRMHLQADEREARVVSGVFAAGRNLSDPLGYAVDPAISARPYDPQAALTLARLAVFATPTADERVESGTNVPRGGVFASLSLVHPSTATARVACEEIRRQLQRIGIDVRLVAAADGAAERNSAAEADLTYCVVSSLEPCVDAFALFGPGGLLASDDSEVLAALAALSSAGDFGRARTILHDLHRIVHERALVAPLWQVNEYAAHRGRLSLGPKDRSPTSLYQFVDAWRVAPKPSEPLP